MANSVLNNRQNYRSIKSFQKFGWKILNQKCFKKTENIKSVYYLQTNLLEFLILLYIFGL